MNVFTFGRIFALSFVGLVACGDDEETQVPVPEPMHTALARLKNQNGADVGTVSFSQQLGGETTQIKIAITSGITPGEHGIHIHEVGRCDPPDFTSAGAHWNPTGEMHGDPRSGPHHSGDFGNVVISEDGTGDVELTSGRISLEEGATHSILGLSVIYHANRDDYVTQEPPGNSGARLACGIITP